MNLIRGTSKNLTSICLSSYMFSGVRQLGTQRSKHFYYQNISYESFPGHFQVDLDVHYMLAIPATFTSSVGKKIANSH